MFFLFLSQVPLYSLPEDRIPRSYLRVYDGGRSLRVLAFGEGFRPRAEGGAFNLVDIQGVGDRTIRVRVIKGGYTLPEEGGLRLSLVQEFSMTYGKTKGVPGSKQKERALEGAEIYFKTFQAPKGGLLLDGFFYKSSARIIDELLEDQDLSRRAAGLHLLYNLASVWTPQSRIPGFGGIGMLNYRAPYVVRGMVKPEEGSMALDVQGVIRVSSTFRFKEFWDLPHIKLNGEYQSVSDIRGNGTLRGEVLFELYGLSKTWRGKVEYHNIGVRKSTTSQGEFLVSLEGTTQGVPYNNTNPGILDFSVLMAWDLGEALPKEKSLDF